MEIALGILYYCIGVAGFIYWWTSEHDLLPFQIFIAGLAGLMGPVSWIIGYLIHGKSILIKKRKYTGNSKNKVYNKVVYSR